MKRFDEAIAPPSRGVQGVPLQPCRFKAPMKWSKGPISAREVVPESRKTESPEK